MRISVLKDRVSETFELTELIRDNSIELNDRSLDALLQAIGNAKYVLLGEASHGTHEYYTLRAKISKRLIKEKGFSFVAVEGDWPDCYRLNRYVKGYKDSYKSVRDVLHEFDRWPTWMWANWEIAAFGEGLHKHNASLPLNKRVGFYGLDVYSLWESLEAVINYLDKVDPQAKQIAMEASRCFEPFSEDEGQSYARATQHWVPASCENEVIELLLNIRKKMEQYDHDPEAALSTEQNALIAVNAERYYRAVIHGGAESWNIRDHHMVDTLDRLMEYHGKDAKAIVWEHNTHIGDARATDMRDEDMVNVGQLVNETHEDDGVFSVGFGSYEGTVIAGKSWGDTMRRMEVPKAKEGSWEYILHQADAKDRLIIMNENLQRLSSKKIGHRAIGVVYHPHWEYGNYAPSILPKRYNAFIFIDKTKALHPMHIKPDGHEMPETFPFGV